MSSWVTGQVVHEVASRFIGVRELPGAEDDPFVMAMLRLDQSWPDHDEVPWCSAFVNWVAWLLRLPRSKSLRARSWLEVGEAVDWRGRLVHDQWAGDRVVVRPGRTGVEVGDVVVLSRPPNPEHGHVGFFAGWETLDSPEDRVVLLGGNQGNRVGLHSYAADRVIGVRRLV